MTIRVEAVYQDGVIKPKEPLEGLADREAIIVTIEKTQARLSSPERILELLDASFAGLTAEQENILREARVNKLRG